jgi:hypothetical protein
MDNETAMNLLNDALDLLLDLFGSDWLICWAIDNGLTDKQINDYIIEVDSFERIKVLREEMQKG